MSFDSPFDGLVERALLWAIPDWVTPNQITIARLILCPVAAAFYLTGPIWVAVVVFAVAALLDLVDGALARLRGPITDLGLFLDPLADKLLVGVMLLCVGWSYLVVKIVVVLIVVELVALIAAKITQRRVGLMAKSNAFGKIKMWVQSVGVGLLLLAALFTGSPALWLGRWGSYLLWVGLALAVMSATAQVTQSTVVRRRIGRGKG
ncbi:MAG: CDP-alcohol phosphatidyltransferase family protein [Actinobacteria bacterium]|nr:CDP-alcohol phosphatidyltransferase family protein [Actinomycetota bacterium]